MVRDENLYFVLNEPELRHCPHVKMFGYRRLREAMWLRQHLNAGIEICLLSKGRFDWTIEGRSYQMRSNDCTFTLPWQKHGGTHGLLDAGELYWIIIGPKRYRCDGTLKLGAWSHLPGEVQKNIGQTLYNAANPYIAANGWIRQIFHELNVVFRSGDTSMAWRINRLIDELLYAVAGGAADSQVVRRDVLNLDQVRRRVMEQLDRRWTLDDLVPVTGYGKTQLTYLVRSATGLSPMAMVRRLRVDVAQHWLKTSTLDITDIALRCGFQSSQQFATVFRKLTGVSPSAWRQQRK